MSLTHNHHMNPAERMSQQDYRYIKFCCLFYLKIKKILFSTEPNVLVLVQLLMMEMLTDGCRHNNIKSLFFFKKALINNILMHETDGQQHHWELNDSRCYIYTKFRNYSRNIDLLTTIITYNWNSTSQRNKTVRDTFVCGGFTLFSFWCHMWVSLIVGSFFRELYVSTGSLFHIICEDFSE